MGYLGALSRNWFAFMGPGVTLLYPLYASVRAMERPSRRRIDDEQWLTYWIIHSFLTLFELSCWKILQWVPLWAYMKLIFCLWLVLPTFNGAAYIYHNFLIEYSINVGNNQSNKDS